MIKSRKKYGNRTHLIMILPKILLMKAMMAHIMTISSREVDPMLNLIFVVE
jgi:hypothetical protein